MEKRIGKDCPKCNRGTTVKRINKSTSNMFIGCDQFPKCKYSKNWNTKAPRRRSYTYAPTYLQGMDVDELHWEGYGSHPDDQVFY